jgi:hypothetical protein
MKVCMAILKEALQISSWTNHKDFKLL